MTFKRTAIAAALLVLAGCAADSSFEEGKKLLSEGKTEAGLERLDKASRDNPRNAEIRTAWSRERALAIARLAAEAENARNGGRFAEAESLYRRALSIDPNDARAREGMDALVASRRHEQQIGDAQARFDRSEMESAEAIARIVLAADPAHPQARALLARIMDARSSRGVSSPVLGAAAAKPINLEFRDASLRSVFDVIAKTSGVNFVFDKDVRPDLRSTINARNSTVDDVIRLILMTNQLERKVLNENTMLIYPNTPAKQKEYQELVVRTFYLANADIKQTLTMIKTMVKTRDVFIDEKLGLLVMRDTPEAVRVAEKLIAAQDLAEPEVTLEVEVLEVASNRVQELGLRVAEQVLLTNPATVAAGGVAAGTLARASGGLTAFVAAPPIIINLRQQDGITNVLANPRIRVKNREKARIHIGDRVPVITTTATANVGVSASVSYLDVGLKLDVEPTVQLQGEVIMKVGLEVSNITREVATTGGGLAYQLGTRNAATTLRVRDGETQVLAGLIQDDERRTVNRIPGLGSLPIIGRLFSNNNESKTKTEIVLLITPRIVRTMVRPDHVVPEYFSGTDAAIGAQPLSIRSGKGSVTMSGSQGASATAPAALDRPDPGATRQQAAPPAPQPAAPGAAQAPSNEPFQPSQPQPLGAQPPAPPPVPTSPPAR
ncbi:MAG: ral secretion pathway protein GspD [Betaproteobacteria bacterium]|nr:ral secretion pathway protein GspD [Betaproteobacteria bacterium]